MTEQVQDIDVGLQTIAQTTGQFTSTFLKTVAEENAGNLITSPLSVQVILAMAAYGADETTATQMRTALLIPSDDKLGQAGYHSLIKTLNVAKGVELRLANKIYTAAEFKVKPAYKELTMVKFLSTCQEVDFSKPAEAASTINAWCEEQTDKRIKNVVNPGSLDPDTKLILINAVYFKGQWERKFNSHLTQDRPFYIDEKTTKNVPTMFMKQSFRYGALPEIDARFIDIPYQENELSMIIILPNQVNGLKTILDNLNRVNISQSLKKTYPREVELYLPKFKIENTLDLESTLNKMGMIDMFDNRANFSGIANVPLKVNKIIQKAFIEVNEEGSEAAAVTKMMIKKRKCAKYVEPDRFKVDHPGLFVIWHSTNKIVLFVGSLTNP